jgi:hypothetical protein
MSDSTALWELDVSVSGTVHGQYRIAGTFWQAPVYPSFSGTARIDATGGRVIVASFPSQETTEPIAAVSGLWTRATALMTEAERAFLRLTLELPPELESLDWETAFEGALVVRRPKPMSSRGSASRRVALRLPLSVGVVDPTGTLATEIYRDPHLAAVRDLGVRIVADVPGLESVILHVVAARDDVAPWLESRLADRSQLPVLVVVETSGTIPAGLEALARRTKALLTTQSNPESLRVFYRALLHNTPIDRSLAFALEATGSRRYRLWADGDERLPLLTTAVLESASAYSLGAVALENLRGVGPRTSEQPPRHRLDAVTRDLRLRLDEMSLPLDSAIKQTLGSVRAGAIDFSAEDHGVRAMANVQDQIDTATELASARESLRAPREVLQEAVARVTSLWLREADGRSDLANDQALVCGREYRLAVRIGRPQERSRASAAFPEGLLARAFRQHDMVELDVVVFSPADDFKLLAPSRAKLRLARFGDSETVELPLQAMRAGVCRLRACIYHGLRLLQSIWLEARVDRVEGAAADPGGAASQVGLDYTATADFALLESLPSPDASIVVNEASGGSHWLGVYAPEAGTTPGEPTAQLFTVSDDRMQKVVGRLQTELEKAAVYGLKYRFADDAVTDAQWQQREQTVVALARAGRQMCRTLLGDAIRPALRLSARPGVLSVGRCSGDGIGVPWAACYDYGLDPAQPESGQIVCPVFSAQARAGHDRLDDPAGCRAQADCPLNTPGAEQRVVCPFGFWGVRHQIEQPLHHVPVIATGPNGQAKLPPVEAVVHGFRETGGRLRVACGRYQFADAETHPDELKSTLDLDVASHTGEIMTLIKAAGTGIVYFFCHGLVVNGEVVLQVGSATSAENIGADTLDVAFEWAQPQPLVFLNGCDTVAFSAEAINDLTTAFRVWGAAGVIGTEFSVPRALARTVGSEILERLARGATVGQAFLAVRRALLRKMNPLALAYSAYASAWLHYAPTAGCPQCPSTTANSPNPITK